MFRAGEANPGDTEGGIHLGLFFFKSSRIVCPRRDKGAFQKDLGYPLWVQASQISLRGCQPPPLMDSLRRPWADPGTYILTQLQELYSVFYNNRYGKRIWERMDVCTCVIEALGLPWWFSGKESVCRCRRHVLDPGRSHMPQSK